MKRIISIRMSAEEARGVLQGKRDSLCILIKPQPSKDAQWVNSGYIKDGSAFIFPTYKPGDTAYIREPWLLTQGGYIYQADDPVSEIIFKPGSQMPKEAARLWIDITGVKAIRLQQHISRMNKTQIEKWNARIKQNTKELLHDERIKTYGYNANPLVWVIEFKKIEKPL